MTNLVKPSPPSLNALIHVAVRVSYLAQQSSPAQSHYVYGYTITITNTAPTAVKLLSRHWVITDANNQTRDVRGDGVVGEQPLIAPNASYTYSSGCVMETDIGTMGGSYQMITTDGTPFDATIPIFTLIPPFKLH